MLAIMAVMAATDLTVLSGDDPRAQESVKLVLGQYYDQLKQYLPLLTLVDSYKGVCAVGGSVVERRRGWPREMRFLFEWREPSTPGPLLVFSGGTLPPLQAVPVHIGSTLVEGMRRFLGDSIAVGSGPWVDFLEFDDGSNWGADSQGRKNRRAEREAILQKVEAAKSDEEAREVLKAVRANETASLIELDLAGRLLQAPDMKKETLRVRMEMLSR